MGVYFQNPECITIGDNCWIDRGVIIMAGRDTSSRARRWVGPKNITSLGEVRIGKNVHIGPYCILSGIEAGIIIGDDCGFSSGVKAYAFSHHFRFENAPSNTSCAFGPMVPHESQSMLCGPIVLKRNVGVALNSILLPGVVVGEDSFVMANSVVHNNSFEPNSIISGCPAVFHGPRFTVIDEKRPT